MRAHGGHEELLVETVLGRDLLRHPPEWPPRLDDVRQQPPGQADAVTASVETGFGTIGVDWTTDAEGSFTARYTIPFGVPATFDAPADSGSTVRVDGREVGPSVTMGPGLHEVTVSSAQITRPAVPSLR